jgi:hypothetical protein
MGGVIITAFTWIFRFMVAKFVLGLGFVMVSAPWIKEWVTDAINFVTQQVNMLGPPGEIILMAGLADALSIIAGALLARATIVQLSSVFGVKTS